VTTRRARLPRPLSPADDDDKPLPVRIILPATAEDEAEICQRIDDALAWLVRQRLDA
jgi:hypothetical protein